MRVLMAVRRMSHDAGTEVSAFQGARALARRGHAISLLYGEEGELLPEFEKFCHSTARARRVLFSFPESRRSTIREHAELCPALLAAVHTRPDVIWINEINAMPWAVPAARVTRAPVVCHLRLHITFGPHIPGFFATGPRYFESLSSRIDAFIANSAFMAAQWIESGLDSDRVAVVHNGIDPADYPLGRARERSEARAALGIAESTFVALYYGRLHPDKGLDVLIDAWRRLDRGPSDAQLLVVGSRRPAGGASDGMECLDSITGRDGITVLAARRDVVPLLHAADVVVVPSTWQEPFGRVVIEALSTGRPVIASRVGGIPEIMTGDLERFLVEPGDAAALAEALSEVAGWQQREPDLAETAAARVRSAFTLDTMIDGVEQVLSSAQRSH